MNIADRTVDEVGLAEEVGRHFYVGRQRGFQFGQRLVQAFGQIQRIGSRLFGHREKYGIFPLCRGATQFGHLCSRLHLGHTLQGDGPSAGRALHNGAFQRIGTIGRKQAAHDVFVAIFIERATSHIAVHVLQGFHELVEANTVVTHLFRMNQHLIFFDVAAQYGDLCHSAQ